MSDAYSGSYGGINFGVPVVPSGNAAPDGFTPGFQGLKLSIPGNPLSQGGASGFGGNVPSPLPPIAPTNGTGGPATASPTNGTGFFASLAANASDYFYRIVLIVLGLVFVAVGLHMLAPNTIAIPGVKAP